MFKNISKKQFAALLSIVSNTSLTVGKIIVGISCGSISILSEAIHSGIDLAASLIAFFSIRVAETPADRDHQYGHGKYEDISGLAEAALIFIAAIIILYEASSRLLSPVKHEIETLPGIIVMLVSVVVNFLISRYLNKVGKESDSIALLADAKHLETDVYTSLGVFVGMMLISFTGISLFDPIMAILVAILICFISYKITLKSISNLVDVSLPSEEVDEIKEIISKYSDEIVNIHGFKSRKSGNIRFIDFHLIIPEHLTIGQGHLLCDLIEEDILKHYPDTKISIHIEPCYKDCSKCSFHLEGPCMIKSWNK